MGTRSEKLRIETYELRIMNEGCKDLNDRGQGVKGKEKVYGDMVTVRGKGERLTAYPIP